MIAHQTRKKQRLTSSFNDSQSEEVDERNQEECIDKEESENEYIDLDDVEDKDEKRRTRWKTKNDILSLFHLDVKNTKGCSNKLRLFVRRLSGPVGRWHGGKEMKKNDVCKIIFLKEFFEVSHIIDILRFYPEYRWT